MHNNTKQIGAALAWVRSGFEQLWREPARWLGMTLVYLVIALVLKRIPFLGNFVLVLITPVTLASALRALTAEAARDLFRVFEREERAVTTVIVCIVTLGFVVLVSIPELLITGGSVVSGLAGAGLAGPLRLTAVLGMAVVAVLY